MGQRRACDFLNHTVGHLGGGRDLLLADGREVWWVTAECLAKEKGRRRKRE